MNVSPKSNKVRAVTKDRPQIFTKNKHILAEKRKKLKLSIAQRISFKRVLKITSFYRHFLPFVISVSHHENDLKKTLMELSRTQSG